MSNRECFQRPQVLKQLYNVTVYSVSEEFYRLVQGRAHPLSPFSLSGLTKLHCCVVSKAAAMLQIDFQLYHAVQHIENVLCCVYVMRLASH